MGNLGENLGREQERRQRWLSEQAAKCGDYINDACPNCNRMRLMRGSDGKHRCEKCCWCVEDRGYDMEFLDYSR